MIAVATVAAAVASPTPRPAPSATAAGTGPCAAPALSSIAVRPGIGRAPAAGGAVCVAPPGVVVVGAGYRDQVTTGPDRQELLVYPAPVALIGVPGASEIIVSPSLAYSRRIGTGQPGLPASSGLQDAGLGFQHVLSDGPALQQALEAFVTIPTGYPAAPTGFSLSAPTYQVAHAVAFSLTSTLGLTLSNAFVVAYGAAPSGSLQRYVAYQPSLSLSYALTPATTLLLENQIAAPSAPHGPAGNRALLGVQRTLSPNFVIDVEYELNALPPPGFSQHTLVEGGLTVRL